ncbi:4902_t:CDS:2, partial [Racocetra persica]
DKNKETILHLFIDISKDFQHLLNTKIPAVVVEPPAINTNSNSELQHLLNTEVSIVVVETPAIDTDFDSNNLSPIFTTEVPIVLIEPSTIGTDLELTNTQSNLKPHHEKDQNSEYATPRFPLFCTNSKIQLPPLFELPPYLLYLYTSTNPDVDNYKVALCEDILYQAHMQLQDLDDTSDILAIIEYEALTQFFY